MTDAAVEPDRSGVPEVAPGESQDAVAEDDMGKESAGEAASPVQADSLAPEVPVQAEAAALPQATTLPTPGEMLREGRVRMGMSFSDVARHLKLHPRQVEALERDDYATLPGPVFVRGFLRNYARLLGLEGEVLIAQSEKAGRLPAPSATTVKVTDRGGALDRHHPRFRESTGRHGSVWKRSWLPLALGLIVIAGILIYFGRRDIAPMPTTMDVSPLQSPAATADAPGVSTQPAPEASATPAPSPSEAAPPPGGSSGAAGVPGGASTAGPSSAATTSPSPATAPAAGSDGTASSAAASPEPARKTEAKSKEKSTTSRPAAEAEASKPVETSSGGSAESAPKPAREEREADGGGGPVIRLSFSRESWVEVRDASGAIVFSQLNPAGSERTVRGQPPFQVTVGNAGGVNVNYNSKDIDLGPHTRSDVAHITLE